MRQMEIKNWIQSFKKRLIKSKSLNQIPSVKLPKLMQSHSYHNLIIRKLEKIKASNYRNRYNSGEKKVKADLSNLFSVHKVETDFFKNLIKVRTNLKYIFNQNKNNNSLKSANSFSNNSVVLKTTVSNNNNSVINYNPINSSRFCENNSNKGNLNNLNNNKIKVIKIKSTENCKNILEDLNSYRINSDCCFFKKKYYINKNNFNKDIFKLINDDNNCIFCPKTTKNQKNYEINNVSNIEEEKNEN